MRVDITPETVAKLWIDGWPVKKIARSLGCCLETVDLRLRKAKALFPDLEWDKRRDVKAMKFPQCELQCTAISSWIIISSAKLEQHFFCGWHLQSGIRAARQIETETLTIREILK